MKNQIKEFLSHSRNPFEVSRMTGAKLSEVRKIMREEPMTLSGWGKPKYHPYIISRRGAFDPAWPLKDAQVIIDHKRLHDQGRVTMCQGRDEGWIIQYAFPLEHPVQREPYFYGG